MKSLLTILPVLALLAVGCQKPTQLNDEANLDLNASGLNCQSGNDGLSVSEAQIQGLENLKSGQKATLSLGSEVNCNQAQKATWSIGSKVIGTGPEVQAQIRGSGVYFVSVSSSAPNANGLSSKTLSESLTSNQLAVTNSSALISGPQAGTEGIEYTFSLVLPEGVQASEASWNFGDGSDVVPSTAPVKHSFMAGVYDLSVQVKDSNGQSQTVTHQISILPILEGAFCPLDQMAIVGPTEIPMQRPVEYSLNLSTCLKNMISEVSWDFGDGTAPATTQTVQHAFMEPGNYTIEVTIQLGPDAPSVTLVRQIRVVDNMEEMPGPVDDGPQDPNRCTTPGATRTVDGATSTREVACGAEGMKTNTYQIKIVETCDLVGERLSYHETSRSEVLLSEGECMGQSCELITENGKEILKNGESRVLYTSKSPANSCESVKETRTCSNGTLSGSSQAQYLTCQSGCGDFGSHGTTKVGVVTGEISLPKTCQYGEQGVTDLFHQISDMTCNDGQVVSSNLRQGEIKLAGSCPTYSFAPTEQYTACSADCGGQQTRIYECRDNKGAVAPMERCQGSAPVESRVCDGNPEAVKRTEVSTTHEEAPASAMCPKNQIGVILNERDVTVTKTYACVDHTVQLADTQTTYSPWVTENYCKDFTPSRCNHDSLSVTQAKGRHLWMVKCQDQNPVIKDFLANFDDVKYKGYGIDEGSRRIYPTFMNATTKKPWIAPKVESAPCTTPESIYVAAVCVASCSTPEQQILVEAREERKMKYKSFIDALTENVPVVATLHSASSMSSKTVAKSRVDNWVTELVDSNHEILVFKMKSGGQLKITPNHPLLAQTGVMKLASDFRAGESLVQLGGNLDEIVSIQSTNYFGKVYNVFVKSSDLKKNVVVTNGYLNGTAFYQNEGAKFMNRALFRTNLFRGAFENKGK